MIFVSWCAKDALDGTLQMDPLSELVYRRIIDMIYASGDQLRDDDDMLQYATKAGTKWRSIKKKLVEVYGKICLENGFVRVRKCTEMLGKTNEIIAKNSKAGKASAEKRKSMKENDTSSTPVEITLEKNPTERQLSTNHYKNKKEYIPDPLSAREQTQPPAEPPDPPPDDRPVSWSKHGHVKRSTPWFDGKVIRWSAGEVDDAMRDYAMSRDEVMSYLAGRDEWYQRQPVDIQAGWKLATIRHISQQYGGRKR